MGIIGRRNRVKEEPKKVPKKRDTSKHRELVEIGSSWLLKKTKNYHYKCQFVCPELVCQGGTEDPDIFGLKPYGHVMIEVKVSRSDFLKDKKKRGRDPRHKQLGGYRLYLTPEGLIKVEELPEGWGLLEWDGKKINIIKDSVFFKEDFEAAGYFYHSILRRLFKPQEFNFREKNSIKYLDNN